MSNIHKYFHFFIFNKKHFRMEIDELLKELQDETLSPINKSQILTTLSRLYFENNDIGNALKYAAIASVCTITPSFDVCLYFAALYMALGEYKWSETWYNAAFTVANTKDELISYYESIVYFYIFINRKSMALSHNTTLLALDKSNEKGLQYAETISKMEE